MAFMRRRSRPSRRPRSLLLGLLVALASGAAWWLLDAMEAGGPALQGRATVVDADTLVVAGQRIRIAGIDAPEARQTCTRDGEPWQCGAAATLALRRFLEGQAVTCTGQERDRFDRVLARCLAGTEDVGGWLVRQGWALAYTRYSYRYLPQQALAWWDGNGLWSSSFDTPEEWRRQAN